MANFDELLNRYYELSRNLTNTIRDGKKFIVVTHIDADGLCSGATTFLALARRGATVSVRTVPDLDLKTIDSLREERYDFSSSPTWHRRLSANWHRRLTTGSSCS